MNVSTNQGKEIDIHDQPELVITSSRMYILINMALYETQVFN